jgi:hypothetical protein
MSKDNEPIDELRELSQDMLSCLEIGKCGFKDLSDGSIAVDLAFDIKASEVSLSRDPETNDLIIHHARILSPGTRNQFEYPLESVRLTRHLKTGVELNAMSSPFVTGGYGGSSAHTSLPVEQIGRVDNLGWSDEEQSIVGDPRIYDDPRLPLAQAAIAILERESGFMSLSTRLQVEPYLENSSSSSSSRTRGITGSKQQSVRNLRLIHVAWVDVGADPTAGRNLSNADTTVEKLDGYQASSFVADASQASDDIKKTLLTNDFDSDRSHSETETELETQTQQDTTTTPQTNEEQEKFRERGINMGDTIAEPQDIEPVTDSVLDVLKTDQDKKTDPVTEASNTNLDIQKPQKFSELADNEEVTLKAGELRTMLSDIKEDLYEQFVEDNERQKLVAEIASLCLDLSVEIPQEFTDSLHGNKHLQMFKDIIDKLISQIHERDNSIEQLEQKQYHQTGEKPSLSAKKSEKADLNKAVDKYYAEDHGGFNSVAARMLGIPPQVRGEQQ